MKKKWAWISVIISITTTLIVGISIFAVTRNRKQIENRTYTTIEN